MQQQKTTPAKNAANRALTASRAAILREQLWNLLKQRKVYGLAFRRNEKIGGYSVDFCNHAEKIVVEISDFPFENFQQMDRTMERHLELTELGYTVLGFDAATITDHPGYIREMIKTHVQINHAGGMESFNLDVEF